jgi:hypothetical protein
MTQYQNQNHNLYTLIHEVPQGTRGNSPVQEVIAIDPKTKKAVDPLWVIIAGRNLKYYIVSNITDPTNKIICSFTYTYREDPPGNRSININVTYAVSCPRGSEKRVAESLSSGSDPAEALKNLVIRWIHESINSVNKPFIDSFQSVRGYVASNIKTKASREAGLALEIDLSIPVINHFFFTDTFPVRFRDYDKQESLTINVEIEPDQAGLSLAQMNNEAYIKQLVQTETQNYFTKNISLHSFYFELNKGAIKQYLSNHLSQILRQRGYKLLFISLDKDDHLALPLETFNTRQSIPYVNDDNFPAVSIRNTVILDLQDSAKYRMSGQPDLSAWVVEQLTLAVNSELFGATYMDLHVNFAPLANRIKQRVSAAASKIGYGIQHIVTVPELDAHEWLKFFEVKTEQSEEEFETNVSKFPVRLSIVVNTKLKDLKSVKSYLNSHVPTEMKKDILKVSAQFLRTIDPERFYVRFSHTLVPGEKSVKEELKSRIADVLAQNFDADIREITLRMEETKIMELLNELKRYREEFRVTITPLDVRQPYDVVISGHFRVTDLDYEGWDNFRTSMPTIDMIKRRIVKALETELRNHIRINLIYQDSDELKELTQLITTSAQKTARDDFGLRITVSDIGRERTQRENRIVEKIVIEEQTTIDSIAAGRQALIVQITQQIGGRKARLADLIIEQGSEDEMKEVSRQITELESQLAEVRTSGRLSLPGQPEVKQLQGSTDQ